MTANTRDNTPHQSGQYTVTGNPHNPNQPWLVNGPGAKAWTWNDRATAEDRAYYMNIAYKEGQKAASADTGSWQPVEKLLNACAEQVSMTIRSLQDAERALIQQAARVQGRREAEEE